MVATTTMTVAPNTACEIAPADKRQRGHDQRNLAARDHANAHDQALMRAESAWRERRCQHPTIW